jgi:hypothetical protein
MSDELIIRGVMRLLANGVLHETPFSFSDDYGGSKWVQRQVVIPESETALGIVVGEPLLLKNNDLANSVTIDAHAVSHQDFTTIPPGGIAIFTPTDALFATASDDPGGNVELLLFQVNG